MDTKQQLETLKRRINSVGRAFAAGNCTVGNPTMVVSRNTLRKTKSKNLSYKSKAKNRNI